MKEGKCECRNMPKDQYCYNRFIDDQNSKVQNSI